MKEIIAPVGKITVFQNVTGFRVYGRFGAVMVTDAAKNVTYCNLHDGADEYKRMLKALQDK